MQTLGTLELNGVVYIKSAKLDLDYRGVTCIRGFNANVQTERSNGTGKSLFVSTIPKALFEVNPVVIKKKRGGPKLPPVGPSTIKLEVRNPEKQTHTIQQTKKGNSVRYKIERDGVDLGVRTPTIARQEIRKIFPLTQAEYFAFSHLHVKRRFILHDGTATERYDFFSDVCRLEELFDDAMKHYVAKVKEGREDKIRYETLETELTRLQSEKTIEIPKAQKKIKRLKRELEEAERENIAVVDMLSAMAAAKRIHLIRFDAEELIGKLGLKQDVSVDEVRALMRETSKAVEHRREYDRYLDSRAEYDKELADFLSALKKLPKELRKMKLSRLEHEDELARKTESSINQAISKVRELTDALADSEGDAKKLRQLNEKLGPAAKSKLSDVTQERGALREKIEQLDVSIKRLKKLHSKCPICDSEISEKQKSKLLVERKEKRSKASKQMDKLSVIIDLMRKREELDVGDLDQMKVQLTNARKALKKLRQIRVHKTADIRAALKLRGALENLRKPKKVEKPNSKESRKVLRKRQERLDRLLNMLRLIRSTTDKVEWSAKKQAKLEKRVKAAKTLTNNLMSELSRLRYKVKHAKDLKAQQEKYRAKLKKVGREVRRLKYYEAMRDAYSTKGVKMLFIRNFAREIEDRMNTYAPMLFPEKFTFEFDIDVGKFNILVTRHDKDGTTKTSDVIELSGAETQCFILLCLISILPSIPASRRTNICILDEMDANLDNSSQEMFVNSFVPMLATIIPHVIIVTPSYREYANARNLYVVKQGSVSSLMNTEEFDAFRRKHERRRRPSHTT